MSELADADAIGQLWERKGWLPTRAFHELLVEKGHDLSWSQVCHRLRDYCESKTGNRDITAYRAKYAEPDDDAPPKDASERTAMREDEDGAVAWSIGQRITTLDQLLDACKVDMELWEVDRYIVNKWEIARRDELKNLTFTKGKIDGEVLDEGGMTLQPLIQVKAWLKRREIRPFEAAFEMLLNTIRERVPAVPALVRPNERDYLLVPSFMDAHFGVLAADGENYSLSVAEQQLKDTVASMIQRVRSLDMPVDRILLPVGNDVLHVDNLQSMTTNMTWVQASADVRDAIVVVARSYTNLIGALADIAPVDVVSVAGNHDALNTYWLGLYLDAWYHNNARVQVDVGKQPRKYYRYGRTLLGLTHGDRIKAERLVVAMATESPPKAWAGTSYREWLIGHFHRKANMHYSAIEEGGVHVRVMPALVPTDNWHKLRGFVGNHRAATALYYHKQFGPAGEFPVFVEQPAARAVAV